MGCLGLANLVTLDWRTSETHLRQSVLLSGRGLAWGPIVLVKVATKCYCFIFRLLTVMGVHLCHHAKRVAVLGSEFLKLGSRVCQE